jgi:septal ring-binding cell division protein DamX
MSKQALQQRLTHYSGLLASQRQLLQRLLLQLEFNQPDRLQLVGSSGSGKSTLILTLAEICSEQFNVALVQADASLAPVDVLKVLQQQWVGSTAMPRTLTDFVAQLSKSEQYLLLVDDADQLNDESWQLLRQLPVSVFVSCLKAKNDIRLAMNIPAFGEDEAAELLAPYNLQGREQRERIEDCAGDLHLLLHGLNASAPRKPAIVSKPKAERPVAAFSARDDRAAPAFVASTTASSFDLSERENPLGLRATDTADEQPSFSIETERRSDYLSDAAAQKKPVKQASGQFFSPFLVMSLGFGLIAAVVMFWLWTEQQFRQPIADDMVPYYPSSTTSDAAARLQTERQFEPTVEIKQEIPAEVASSRNNTVATPTEAVQDGVVDQGLPQMAMEKTSDTASMTVQQEVAKDDNGLPQKQIVSMTIESEPMREQPVIPALPAAGEEAPVTEPQPETETPVQPLRAEVPVATEPNDLVAEMEADAADTGTETLPAPTTAADTPAGYDAAALLGMLPDTVAIQLGVFSQEAAATKFLQQYSNLNLQLYKRQQQGKTQFVVVSASYVNGGAARQQVKSLPEELRQQTPFVKPLSDIQREIRSANAN